MAYLRKYGTAITAGAYAINVPLIKAGVVDFAVSADWTPASGDVKVSLDGGAAANIATLPAFITGVGWQFVFSSAELTAKRVEVRVVDTATKAVEDQAFTVETFGHASAMYPTDWSVAHANQTGDSYAIVNGASGNVAIKTAVDTKASQASVDLKASQATADAILEDTGTTIPATLAGLLTSADFTSGLSALMLSASRRVTLGTGLAYEIPDSGTAAYFIELRTFDEDGAAVAADSTPALAATGGASGDLSANLSAATNPATGVYRWTYTVDAADPVEPIRLDAAATIDGDTFTVPAFPVVTDAVAVDFTSTDRATLSAIKAKSDLIPATPAVAGEAATAQTNILAKVLRYFRLTLRKDAALATDHATELGEINANAGSGAGAYANTTDAQEAIRDRGDAEWVTGDGGGGSSISGAHNLVVTVTNSVGGGNLQNARVRLYLNADDETKITGTNGQPATPFTLDDGTWNYTAKLPGFSGTSGTKVIAGADSTLAILLTPLTIPAPADADKLTGWFVALDNDSEPAAGINFELNLLRDGNATGTAVDTRIKTLTSDANGLVSFSGFLPGRKYLIKGSSRRVTGEVITVPALDDDSVTDGTFEIPEFEYRSNPS